MTITTGMSKKHDALVKADDDPVRLELHISSPVGGLFGVALEKAALSELEELGVRQGIIHIVDNHAFDFVIRARIRAAVMSLRAQGGQL